MEKLQPNLTHLSHLEFLDTLLQRIWNNGQNAATQTDILTGEPPKPNSKLVAVFDENPNRPENDALPYLIEEGYVRKGENTHSLTFKGTLKTHGKSFVQEYRESVFSRNLLYEMQASNIERNRLYFWFSFLSILLSFVAIVIALS